MKRALAIVLALVALAAPARAQTERVVCVSKQINEFMYAIGAQGVLVGRDLTSVYPPAILKLPSVGYHRALNAEGIISLRPTLFLTDGNFGPAEVTAQLEKVGIPILTIIPGDTARQRGRAARDARQALPPRTRGRQRGRRDAAEHGRGAEGHARWVGKARPRVLIIHFGQIANDYLGAQAREHRRPDAALGRRARTPSTRSAA